MRICLQQSKREKKKKTDERYQSKNICAQIKIMLPFAGRIIFYDMMAIRYPNYFPVQTDMLTELIGCQK